MKNGVVVMMGWQSRRWARFLSGLAIAALSLSACQGGVESGDDRPLVVTTSTMLTDWATEVGGDAIAVQGILTPGADPHVYEPVPQDSAAFEQADLILYNGYNLEPGLIRMMRAVGGDATQLAVGEVVTPLDLTYDGQTVPDPHVWGDVEQAIAMVAAIRDALITLQPSDAAVFRANAERYMAELAAVDQWITAQIATIPPEQRQFVTTHDAFQYYAQAYGLEVIGTLIGISTEEQPSAQTLRQLVEAIKAAQVPAIFAETTINPQLIQTVAAEAGVPLAPQSLYSDSLGAPGSAGETYLQMMMANTEAIVTALGGTVTPRE